MVHKVTHTFIIIIKLGNMCETSKQGRFTVRENIDQNIMLSVVENPCYIMPGPSRDLNMEKKFSMEHL